MTDAEKQKGIAIFNRAKERAAIIARLIEEVPVAEGVLALVLVVRAVQQTKGDVYAAITKYFNDQEAASQAAASKQN